MYLRRAERGIQQLAHNQLYVSGRSIVAMAQRAAQC
jgi:hypothetical protein